MKIVCSGGKSYRTETETGHVVGRLRNIGVRGRELVDQRPRQSASERGVFACRQHASAGASSRGGDFFHAANNYCIGSLFIFTNARCFTVSDIRELLSM